jgi:putative ABC transport system permease protein
MATLIQDLRYAFRTLAKNRGFTAVAIITLALGIGANTAIFSVVNSVLIKPLPYPDSQQLVRIYETLPGFDRNSVSGGAFKDWHGQSSKFAHLAVYEETRLNLTGGGMPERVSGLKVSSEFLSALGVTPTVGRGFVAGEDAVGGNNRVIVLTHQLWQGRFGGDAGVVGRTVSLDQIPYTVIGVLPPNVLLQDDAMFLVPDVIDAAGANWERAGHWRQVIGRVLPGVTVSEVQAELRGIKQRLTAEYPSFKKDWSVAVVPMQEVYAGDTRPILVVLLGAVALVLLIACANVSNLLLARGNARSREMAIRAALGADSWRIVRQILVESLLLAVAGCAVGLLFALFGVKLLTSMFAGLLPQVLQPKLDINVLLFSIGVACGCGLLFGVLPAWRTSKPDLNHALKETERASASRSKRRSQSFLVVSEFAFTLMLLVGVGLFLRSFVLLLETNPGFNPRQTLAFDLSFPDAKYPKGEDRLRFIKDLNARVAALRGVESVGATSALPLSNDGRTEFAGRADKPPRTDYIVACNFVSGDYFSAMGMPLLRGRAISESDNHAKASRVLVVDESVVRDLYPDEDPIGQHLSFLDESWEIVGIVAPVRQFFLDRDPRPTVYGPQSYSPMSTSMIIRTAQPPLALVKTVRKTILEADPDQPIANVRTLEQAVHNSLAPRRTRLILLGLFATVAISLASIGIYGVMSYAIGQRTRELCIRTALGAQRRDIMRLVLIGGMKPSIIGIVVGLAAALALARLLESQLFEVKAHDPLVFVASVCLLGLVAALSVYFPARRATKVDPMVALRYE